MIDVSDKKVDFVTFTSPVYPSAISFRSLLEFRKDHCSSSLINAHSRADKSAGYGPTLLGGLHLPRHLTLHASTCLMSFLRDAARPCRASKAWCFSMRRRGLQQRPFSQSRTLGAPLTSEEVRGAHQYCVALLSYATFLVHSSTVNLKTTSQACSPALHQKI